MTMGVTRLDQGGRVGRIRADGCVWIDIDNPPQVQYLLPFRAAFEAAGLDTVVTARDYGRTVEMLRAAGARPHVFGKRVGRGRLRKGAAALHRAHEQTRFFAEFGHPDVLLAASRSAAVAARRMGIPGYLIGDYEHIHLGIYRFTDSKIFYPELVGAAHYLRHGLRPDQLIPFRGLKEDLTFAGLDIDRVEAHDLGDVPAHLFKVLFRPPSETSHYHDARSTEMARATLAWLAEAGALVVFAPREPSQVRLLEDLPWRHPPLTLERSVPFASLLKCVDAVICSGGTMLREAAYLGIPAYSIFCSQTGAVDRWLQDIGRAVLLQTPADLSGIELRKRGPLKRLDTNPQLLDQLAEVIIAAVKQRRRGNRCLLAA
jgi:predicted glycosyltransferase